MMKTGTVVLAAGIALFSLYQAFPGASVELAITGEGSVRVWALIQAALAGVSAVAVLKDFVLLAALCAMLLILVSLITFFGCGLYVVVPAAILVISISALYK